MLIISFLLEEASYKSNFASKGCVVVGK